MLTSHGKTLTIAVDESIYERVTVLRTAYWFTDRCYVFLTRSRPGEIEVRLQAKQPTLDQPCVESLEQVAGEFTNALLDHQLRTEIERQTGKVKELLIAKAFAEAGLIEDTPPGGVADPVEEKAELVSISGQRPCQSNVC